MPGASANQSETMRARDEALRTIRPTPLPAALAFVFVSSIGTGIVTSGIFFLTKHAYGFSDRDNYLLGVVEGVMYIAGALGAGPTVRAVRRVAGVRPRAVLGGILLALAVTCALPLAVQATGATASWPIWVLMLLYIPLTGALWPITESYVSGGRHGPRLRATLGQFNIAWASALVVGYWALAPLVRTHAAEAIAGVGMLHVASLAALAWFGSDPPPHDDHAAGPRPPAYRPLLITFRILLPTSYAVFGALTPFLPSALTRLDVAAEWQTPVSATWMAARLGVFIVLQRWHAWHGRWYPAAGGAVLLLGGFALCVLPVAVASSGPAMSLMILGLLAFGVGMAVIYAGALYYAMSVGKAQVEAGGTHEALIGVGYAGGPLCGLIAAQVVHLGWIAPGHFEAVMLALVGVMTAGAGAIACRRVWQASRSPGPSPAAP